MAIQMRRGEYDDFDASKMLAGELAVVVSGDPETEGGALYVATAAGSATRVAFADEIPGDATTTSDGLMSAADKAKLDGVAAGAQANVIESVSVNGNSATVTGKAAAVTIPEATDAASGVMGAGDKAKLDGIAAGAKKVTITETTRGSGAQVVSFAVQNPDGTFEFPPTAVKADSNGYVDMTSVANGSIPNSKLATPYSLPTMSASTKGGATVGDGLAMTGDALGIADGSITGVKIADNTIPDAKLVQTGGVLSQARENADDLYLLGKKSVPCNLVNGTIVNPANPNYVTTSEYVEVECGQTVRCAVDKPLESGQYFAYGYRLFDASKNVINGVDISANAKDNLLVVEQTDAKYIRWMVGVYDSSETVVPQRVATFGGTVSVEVYGDVVVRNSDVLINAKASCRSGMDYTYGGTYHDPKVLSLLFVTDLHESLYSIYNAVKYLNAMDFVDAGVCLGDMGDYVASNGLWYTNRVNLSDKPFYTVLGNHDLGNSASTSYGATVAQAFAKWVSPTLSTMGMPDLTTPYYMVKSDTHKVCLVVLNNYDVPDDTDAGSFVVNRGSEVYTQTQVDWLLSQLDSVPSDYTLIIAMHSFPYANSGVKSNFTQVGESLSGNGVACYTDLIPDIVNAWKNGAALDKTYEPHVQGVTASLTVNHSFVSRGQGLFACYFVGHSHRDVMANSTTYPDQIAIGFAAGATNNYHNRNADLPRIFGEKSEDVITLAGIDTTHKRVNLCRIGSNVTTTMVDRTMTSISYA